MASLEIDPARWAEALLDVADPAKRPGWSRQPARRSSMRTHGTPADRFLKVYEKR
ncbi:MAG: hypothetical protein ACLUIR_02035 [Faecalibacterium prausnitzii]